MVDNSSRVSSMDNRLRHRHNHRHNGLNYVSNERQAMSKYEEHFDQANNIGGWSLDETIRQQQEYRRLEEERFTESVPELHPRKPVQSVSRRLKKTGDVERNSGPLYRILP